MNTPENRELTAEIMFETFNVPGLYIGVQAVLALCASTFVSMVKSQKTGAEKAPRMSLTGTVIDSGDGVTHVIPVVRARCASCAQGPRPALARSLLGSACRVRARAGGGLRHRQLCEAHPAGRPRRHQLHPGAVAQPWRGHAAGRCAERGQDDQGALLLRVPQPRVGVQEVRRRSDQVQAL